MSLQLRIHVVLGCLIGVLVLVSVGSALQFHEIAGVTENEAARADANTAAFALGLLAATVLVFGAWVTRAARASLIDRLAAMEHAVGSIQAGDSKRRLAGRGNDELSRAANAINAALDLRDHTEAAMKGRNRELRALLVALLRERGQPVAISGIDGEIIASTLDDDEAELLRSLAPQLRAAARTLLSRRFVSAAELATDIRVAGREVSIRALAAGEQRVVGWLAVFGHREAPSTTPGTGHGQGPS